MSESESPHVVNRPVSGQFYARRSGVTFDTAGRSRIPRAGGYPVTNIRNTISSLWRDWLKPENHCLVRANSFAEYAPEPEADISSISSAAKGTLSASQTSFSLRAQKDQVEAPMPAYPLLNTDVFPPKVL